MKKEKGKGASVDNGQAESYTKAVEAYQQSGMSKADSFSKAARQLPKSHEAWKKAKKKKKKPKKTEQKRESLESKYKRVDVFGADSFVGKTLESKYEVIDSFVFSLRSLADRIRKREKRMIESEFIHSMWIRPRQRKKFVCEHKFTIGELYSESAIEVKAINKIVEEGRKIKTEQPQFAGIIKEALVILETITNLTSNVWLEIMREPSDYKLKFEVDNIKHDYPEDWDFRLLADVYKRVGEHRHKLEKISSRLMVETGDFFTTEEGNMDVSEIKLARWEHTTVEEIAKAKEPLTLQELAVRLEEQGIDYKRSTIGRWVTKLRRYGLVGYPPGKKKRSVITKRGREYLKYKESVRENPTT